MAQWERRQRWSGAVRLMAAHKRRVAQRSLAVLALVAVAAGAGGFAALESEFEHMGSEDVGSEDVRASAVIIGEVITGSLDAGVWLAETTVTRPVIVEQLARIAASNADTALRGCRPRHLRANCVLKPPATMPR